MVGDEPKWGLLIDCAAVGRRIRAVIDYGRRWLELGRDARILPNVQSHFLHAIFPTAITIVSAPHTYGFLHYFIYRRILERASLYSCMSEDMFFFFANL